MNKILTKGDVTKKTIKLVNASLKTKTKIQFTKFDIVSSILKVQKFSIN